MNVGPLVIFAAHPDRALHWAARHHAADRLPVGDLGLSVSDPNGGPRLCLLSGPRRRQRSGRLMAKTRASLKDDAESGSTRREWLEAQLDRIQFTTYTLLVLFLIAVGFWPKIFIVVPAGQRGVMFRYFKGGTVKDRIWGEGLNITPPGTR